MTCQCVQCEECKGSGSVWRSFSGKYLGRHRCDDMDELETCEECRGSGVTETCEECQMKIEEYELEQEAAEHRLQSDSASPIAFCEICQKWHESNHGILAEPPSA
jgi:RecJ-like exonuclease